MPEETREKIFFLNDHVAEGKNSFSQLSRYAYDDLVSACLITGGKGREKNLSIAYREGRKGGTHS